MLIKYEIIKKIRLFFLLLLFIVLSGNYYINASDILDFDKVGGNLRIGMFIPPTIIHPLYTNHSQAVTMVGLIFNQLILTNCKWQVIGDFASNWRISDDGLVYTFFLRDDVLFHDGVLCTADDVKFTYDSIIDESNGLAIRKQYLNISDIEVIDKFTVVFKIKKPDKYFLMKLNRGILPKHLFPTGNLKNKNFLEHPLGAGPYKYWKKTEEGNIILKVNEKYYKRRAYLETITFKLIKEKYIDDVSLLKNEIDMVNFLSYEQFQDIENDDTFVKFKVRSEDYFVLVYNLNNDNLCDISFRKALAYAISQDRIIKDVFHGYAQKANSIFEPPLSNNEVIYNPKMAIALLESKGFKINDGSLYREKNNKVLELKISVKFENEVYMNIVKNLAVQLSEVGIKLIYVPYTDNGDYDIVLSQMFTGANPDFTLEYWFFYNKSCFGFFSYDNATIKKLMQQAIITEDINLRKELYKEIDKIIWDEQPICFLPYHYYFHAISKKFRNIDKYFKGCMLNEAICDFYLEES